MPKLLVRVVFLFGSVHQISAQEIEVMNKAASKPVADVVIYTTDNNLSVQTDEFGKASVNQFDKDAVLIFQHPSYQDFNVSVQHLKTLNYLILLEEKVTEFHGVVISANKWT